MLSVKEWNGHTNFLYETNIVDNAVSMLQFEDNTINYSLQ